MPKRFFDATAPWQTVLGATRITGLSQGYIRERAKAGTIPVMMVGREYRVNVPLLLRQLEKEAVIKTKASTNMIALER